MERIVFLIILSISTWNSIALEIEYDEVHYAKIGEITHINFDADENCTVITNSDELFEFSYIDKTESLPDWLVEDNSCSRFNIRVNDSHTGTWTFKSDTGFVKKVYIFASKERKRNLDDDERISASLNASVRQWIPSDSIEITSCYLIHRLSKEDRTKFIIRNLSQHTEKNSVQLVGKCGVLIKAVEENIGLFNLYAIDSSGIAIISTFKIEINQGATVYETKNINDIVPRGKQDHIMSHGSNDKSKYCTITDPHGKVLKIENDICSHSISLVTSYHHGIWLFRKFDSDHDEALDYRYNLTVVDDVIRVKVNVTYNEDYITILCNTTGPHVLTTCKFINPSDQYITAGLGMSTKKYEYYGESFGPSYTYQECGIIVHELTELDYGTWKCIMTTDNGTIVGSLIHVHDNSEKIEIFPKSQNTLHVTTNNSFVINCSANRRLSYCSLRSPNGTTYSTGTEDLESDILQYEGLGLDMGECGAKILNGSKTYHDGVWSCHMGIENGPELQSLITVKVLDSIVIPVKNKIEVSSGDIVNLSVAAISGSTFDGDSCEWISPAGDVILQHYDSKYIVTSNPSSCSVAIQGVTEYNHVGPWTCYILHGDEKIQTIIEVTLQSSHTWWIYLIASIVTCIILVIAFYYIVKLAKKVSKNKNLLSDVSSMTTEDPPYIDRTAI